MNKTIYANTQNRGDNNCKDCRARNRDLCGVMSDDTIYTLYDIGRSNKIEKGEYLFMEEAPSTYVYNISSGMLMLERIGSDGRRQIISFVYPGDFIGLTVDSNYSVSCRAIEASRFCRWKRTELEQFAEGHQNLEKSLRVIGNKVLARTIDQIFILGRKNAVERLAFFLLQTSGRQINAGLSETQLNLPMTRTDIADHLGLTIETVSRAFSRLSKDQLIELATPSLVTILDRDRLIKCADNYKV